MQPNKEELYKQLPTPPEGIIKTRIHGLNPGHKLMYAVPYHDLGDCWFKFADRPTNDETVKQLSDCYKAYEIYRDCMTNKEENYSKYLQSLKILEN